MDDVLGLSAKNGETKNAKNSGISRHKYSAARPYSSPPSSSVHAPASTSRLPTAAEEVAEAAAETFVARGMYFQDAPPRVLVEGISYRDAP